MTHIFLKVNFYKMLQCINLLLPIYPIGGATRQGFCSSWFDELSVGDQIPCNIKPYVKYLIELSKIIYFNICSFSFTN